MRDYIYSSMPPQKLPQSKKTKQWKEACVDYISGMYGIDMQGAKDMATNYDLYNGVFDEKDLKHVTSPYGVDAGFPARIQNFNIIRNKVNALLGNEAGRPDTVKIYRTGDEAAGEYQEIQKQLLDQYFMNSLMAKMNPEQQAQFQQQIDSGEVMPPDAIVKYMKNDYKDVAETVAYATYNYLKEKNNTKHEFHKGFKDALIAAREIYYTGIINGEPVLERVNPLYISFDQSPDLEFIEDGAWAVRKMRMTPAEIYDRMYDKLKPSDLDKILRLANDGYDKFNTLAKDPTDINWTQVFGDFDEYTNSGCLDVFHVTWKSFKKVGFLTYLDEAGQPQETIVSEDYAVTGQELALDWDWIIEVWEGYKIGADMYCGIQPLQYQHVSIDNPNSQKLPYTGVIYSNTNSNPKSIVSILKPLQYLYIIIWYRIELALARDKGQVLNMDITQIPKQIGREAWIHYLSSLGVNFFNPYEEGEDVHRGGHAAAYNQFSVANLSFTNTVGSYIQLLQEIERLAATITGITPQAEGMIQNRELVGSVERSVNQSVLATEPIFHMHRECKKRAIKMLIDTAKSAWALSGKKKLHFITDDMQRVFMDISDEFLYEDFDIFVGDDTKELQNIDAMKQLLQPAMQNGATLLDVMEVITLDNTNAIKEKLAKIEEKRMQQAQEAQQQQQEMEMQKIQLENQYREQENAFKQQELELQKYKIDVEAETDIYVAELNAYRGVRELDQDLNGTPDPIEIGKLALANRQQTEAETTAEYERSLKDREMELKAETERLKAAAKLATDTAKIELEKEKLNSQIKLQKMKDEEAYKREELKAKTALKNKTVGEK